jgi:hypothetical protein
MGFWEISDFNLRMESANMRIQEIREIAKKSGVRAGKLDKRELVRAIQKAEGNNDCFATPYVRECNQMNCLWREDCMKTGK